MRRITRQEIELEKHHQNTLRCGGEAESISQSLGLEGYEDTITEGQNRNRERQRLSVTAGAGCLTAGEEELGVGAEERKPGIR